MLIKTAVLPLIRFQMTVMVFNNFTGIDMMQAVVVATPGPWATMSRHMATPYIKAIDVLQDAPQRLSKYDFQKCNSEPIYAYLQKYLAILTGNYLTQAKGLHSAEAVDN